MRKGNNVMAENKFYDYATGKEVRSNPEELYRQLFEHILIDDLGYPKSHIDIEVILQRGAKRNAEKWILLCTIVMYINRKMRIL